MKRKKKAPTKKAKRVTAPPPPRPSSPTTPPPDRQWRKRLKAAGALEADGIEAVAAELDSLDEMDHAFADKMRRGDKSAAQLMIAVKKQRRVLLQAAGLIGGADADPPDPNDRVDAPTWVSESPDDVDVDPSAAKLKGALAEGKLAS